MKVIERVKKWLIGMGVFLLTIPTRVFATAPLLEEVLYMPPSSVKDKEPIKEPILSKVLNVYRIAIIPLVLIIGIIIYLKKSKSSMKKKIMVIIGLIAITTIFYIAIDKILMS